MKLDNIRMSLILPLEKYHWANERHYHKSPVKGKKKIIQQRSDESVLYYHKTTISTKLKRKNGTAFLTTIADNNNSIKRNDHNHQIQQERYLRQKSDFSKLPREQSSRNILIQNELFAFSNTDEKVSMNTDRKLVSKRIVEQKDENNSNKAMFQTSSSLCNFESKKDSYCISSESKDTSNSILIDETSRDNSKKNYGDNGGGIKGDKKSIIEAKQLMQILQEIYHDEEYIKKKDDKSLSEKEIMREAFVTNSKNKWRKYFYIQIIPDIRTLSQKRQIVGGKITNLQSKIGCRLLRCTFRLWRNQNNQSQSKSFSSKLKFFNAVYFTNKKLNVINALSSISLGHSSQRKLLQGRRDAFCLAQKKLTNNLLKQNETHGSVTHNILRQEVNKIFFAEILGWTKNRCLRIYLGSWYQFTVNNKKKWKEAINYHKHKIKHEVLKNWIRICDKNTGETSTLWSNQKRTALAMTNN